MEEKEKKVIEKIKMKNNIINNNKNFIINAIPQKIISNPYYCSKQMDNSFTAFKSINNNFYIVYS